jgi:ferrous iron transport protein B
MNVDLTIALAGNANVGKSSIFNQLTGLGQIIGNWPGKTVEKAEGILLHHEKHIKIVDLPGIYSLSTYSQEEIVSRDYIALEHPGRCREKKRNRY